MMGQWGETERDMRENMGEKDRGKNKNE